MKSATIVATLVALIVSGTQCPVRADGRYFTVDYPASTDPGELVIGVTHTVWIPDGVKTLRGIIVHQHGCGVGACKGGETSAYDLHWQALARAWDCALLGPTYHQAEGQECRLWCDPRNGSAQVFLRALKDLSQKSQHPELEQVPWCLWGHSGGGFWCSLMQTMYPERIVAIWFRSGSAFAVWEKGEIPRPEIPEAAYQIPMMCNPGVKENENEKFQGAWTGTIEMFKAYRAHGALAGFAPDPRTAHECGDSRYLAIPFFDACLALRLPENGSTDQTPRPCGTSQAWLADLLGDKAAPAAEYHGEINGAVWLPNERVARAWMEYVRTGAVDDTTPPPAPFGLTCKASVDGGTELNWDAHADLESGLRAFLIRRDGQDLAQVPDEPQGRFGRPLFQSMSYHDTPEPPLPAMHYVDKSAVTGRTYTYEVIAINSVGLRSEPATVAN